MDNSVTDDQAAWERACELVEARREGWVARETYWGIAPLSLAEADAALRFPLPPKPRRLRVAASHGWQYRVRAGTVEYRNVGASLWAEWNKDAMAHHLGLDDEPMPSLIADLLANPYEEDAP